MFVSEQEKKPDGKADIQYVNEKVWLVFLDTMLLSYPHTVHMEAHLFFSKVFPIFFLTGRS